MIILILVSGLLLRLINLNQSLWLDEAITALAVKNNSFVEIITKFSPGDFHPPFYYLFLKLWTNTFGYSEIALRLPSVIFGVLAIYFVYKIGGKKAAIFMAVNPLAVYYSQEARMYSMVMMFVVMAVYFFINHKRKLFILTFLAALYTDYVPWLLIPVFLGRDLVSVILGLLPLAPLTLTQAGLILQSSGSSWGNILGRADFKNLALIPAKFIFGRISLPVWVYGVFTAIYGYFMASSKNLLFWKWFLTPIVLGFILSFFIPIFTYFRFLFVLPAFILLLSTGKKWQVIVVFAVSLFSLVYFNINSKFWREDWRATTTYINSKPGRVLMPNMAQSAPLQYYGAIINKQDNPTYLIRYVQEIFDPQDTIRINLEKSGFQKIEERSFNGVLVWKYENRN